MIGLTAPVEKSSKGAMIEQGNAGVVASVVVLQNQQRSFDVLHGLCGLLVSVFIVAVQN